MLLNPKRFMWDLHPGITFYKNKKRLNFVAMMSRKAKIHKPKKHER
jgi:hypothetical protein